MRRSPRQADPKLLDFDDVRGRAVTISCMPNQPRYTQEHAEAGLDAKFPEIETWANQFPGYEIVIDDPEFTSVCPKPGCRISARSRSATCRRNRASELKSLKQYLQSYRDLGIFQGEHREPGARGRGEMGEAGVGGGEGETSRPRGGISTVVVARWLRSTVRPGR